MVDTHSLRPVLEFTNPNGEQREARYAPRFCLDVVDIQQRIEYQHGLPAFIRYYDQETRMRVA